MIFVCACLLMQVVQPPGGGASASLAALLREFSTGLPVARIFKLEERYEWFVGHVMGVIVDGGSEGVDVQYEDGDSETLSVRAAILSQLAPGWLRVSSPRCRRLAHHRSKRSLPVCRAAAPRSPLLLLSPRALRTMC